MYERQDGKDQTKQTQCHDANLSETNLNYLFINHLSE